MRFKRFWIYLTKFLTFLFSNKRLSYKRNFSPRCPIIQIVVRFNVHLMRKSTEQTALKNLLLKVRYSLILNTKKSLFRSNKTGESRFPNENEKRKPIKPLFPLAKLKYKALIIWKRCDHPSISYNFFSPWSIVIPLRNNVYTL